MGSQWERPSPPSRGLRLVVFALLALAAAMVVVALLLLAYTAILGPATTG